MKWLKLSVDEFEPTDELSDIQFSLKKPLLAASFVLKFARQDSRLSASCEVLAKVPIKGRFQFELEAISAERPNPLFSFSVIRERDVRSGSLREVEAHGAELKRIKRNTKTNQIESTDLVTVKNHSPAAILPALLVPVAFRQTRDTKTSLYAAHLAVGSRLQALRIERVETHGEVETYEGRLIGVDGALTEANWLELPWATRTPFEFDWHVGRQTIVAARLSLPIVGRLEIKN